MVQGVLLLQQLRPRVFAAVLAAVLRVVGAQQVARRMDGRDAALRRRRLDAVLERARGRDEGAQRGALRVHRRAGAGVLRAGAREPRVAGDMVARRVGGERGVLRRVAGR